MPGAARLQDLIDGYQTFRRDVWPGRRAVYEALSNEGQRPTALVIACSDSRVDPAMIFHAAPGALFVIRNVANLVPPYDPDAGCHGTSAAIEYAVKALDVPHVIVIGHARCGGVEALLNGTPDSLGDFVRPWVEIAARARLVAQAVETGAAPAARALLCEQETVRLSLDNLLSFPFVRERVRDGVLELHGMHYDIASGDLAWLQPDGTFQAIQPRGE